MRGGCDAAHLEHLPRFLLTILVAFEAKPASGTTRAALAIRAASPDACIAAGQDHPVAVATRPLNERAGVGDEVRHAMTAVLREANEEPRGAQSFRGAQLV